MSDTYRDDTSTSSEYFSSDENDSVENGGNKKNLIFSSNSSLDMDFIKSKKQELKKFNVIFEVSTDDDMPKYKKCMKCEGSFSYPHEYLNHCKNTYFRCCDNINIDTEKLSRDEARKYSKYLKNKNADCLNDINNFYKNTFKYVNTDAKIKQKLSQRDITIQNLRCQLEEEKTLRRSLMNTIEKDSNTKIKELTNHLAREMNRENDFQELLIMYGNKLEEAQQTIAEQKQLLAFYEAEKKSIHYGFNKVMEFNEDCSKDIKVIKDKKNTANKTKREKTEKKKKEKTETTEKVKPEKKLETPPVDKVVEEKKLETPPVKFANLPEKKEEIKEEKKEIVSIEIKKPICEKKSDTPPITPQVKYKEYETYTEMPDKLIKCECNEEVNIENKLNDYYDTVKLSKNKVYWYYPLKGSDIKTYIIGSYIKERDNLCIYINEKDKQHENIQKLQENYGCFWQPDAHYWLDNNNKEFMKYVEMINNEENIMNNHEIDTMNMKYYRLDREN